MLLSGARPARRFGVTRLQVYRSPSGAMVGRSKSLLHRSRSAGTAPRERSPRPREWTPRPPSRGSGREGARARAALGGNPVKLISLSEMLSAPLFSRTGHALGAKAEIRRTGCSKSRVLPGFRSCCYTQYDMKRSSKVLAVSVPPQAARDFDRIADQEGRNKSELFREMLRVYRAYRETRTFESLQRYGAGEARRRGIRDERDVERLIQEARRG